MLEKLVEAGADVNAFDSDGRHTLHCAVQAASPPAVALLLAHGADPLATCRGTKTTPLYLAVARRADADLVRPLAERGGAAAINAPQPDGSTCVHLAARDPGMLPVLSCLLQHGGDVTLRDADSSTPLLLAQEANNKEAVHAMQVHCCSVFGIPLEPPRRKAASTLPAKPRAVDAGPDDAASLSASGAAAKTLSPATIGAFLLRGLKRGLLSGAELLSREEIKLTGGNPATPPVAQYASPPETEQDDELACKICFDRSVDAVLLWCGHICCCFLCSNYLRECPICRQRIARVTRVFLS